MPLPTDLYTGDGVGRAVDPAVPKKLVLRAKDQGDGTGLLEVLVAGLTVQANEINVALTKDSDDVTVAGSPDGGTTRVLLKTDAAGRLLTRLDDSIQRLTGELTSQDAPQAIIAVAAEALAAEIANTGTVNPLEFSTDGGTTFNTLPPNAAQLVQGRSPGQPSLTLHVKSKTAGQATTFEVAYNTLV